MESRKDIFEGLHYQVAWFNGFCGGRGKRGALVKKSKGPCQRNVVIMNRLVNFFSGEEKMKTKEDENKKRQEDGQTQFLFLHKCYFEDIY